MPFVDNWHVRAICDHLENMTRNKVTPDLLINIPPGCMKSILCNVVWPTWVWGPYNWPGARWLYASYEQGLATRDSVKCRQVMESPWYRERWGKRFKLVVDQNEKIYYANSQRGWRLATSVGGRGTGEHPDFVIADDPHNVKQSESDVQRQGALNWWTGTISTRGATRRVRKVIVMQRLHVKDLSALALEMGGYDHLCLPMRFEPDRMERTSLGWLDPRTEPGELLWPALWTEELISKVEAALNATGINKVAGQLQQRPTLDGGGLFKEENFKIVPAAPTFEEGDKVGMYWDKAATEDGGDYTAGVMMHVKKDGRIFVLNVCRGQWGIDTRNSMIELRSRVGAIKYRAITIWVEQEPGSGGKESAEYTVKRLCGLRVKIDKKTGGKLDCWEPWACQVNAGNVYLVEGEWNEDFIKEHLDAPVGAHDDQIDSAAGIFNKLVGKVEIDIQAWLKASQHC